MNAVDRAVPAPQLETLLGRLPALSAAIAEGAAQREREGTLPFEAFALFRASGLGALRIPPWRGGPGGSIEDLVQVVATLAAADSNVAHALRTHYNAIELWTSVPPNPDADRQLARVLDGALFGGAFTELGTPRSGTVTTALERQGDKLVLNGRKYYATGTAFSDFASIAVRDEEGRDATVIVPTDRDGLRVKDDWDGMGQRLTASGSLEFDGLEIRPEEVVLTAQRSLQRRHASSLRQLYLVAVAAGIVRNVLSDALHYVRHHGRPAAHSPASSAAEDHFTQWVVGDLAACSHAVGALIADNARQLDRSAEALRRGAADGDSEEEGVQQLVLEGALATAKTQLAVSKIALQAAERLFEAGGASATSRKHNFDRHWRNLRTIFNHNPLLQKARVVGDYHLNGTTKHLEEGKVF
ncbi:acyl-CoA dehydrogenase family protein [Variovorax fucosicus]|uniref:acyl-CoA dehydrogenase family protein n=1 Tax=Variovorax fucosicus TaxID=3053517 RepID=UPI002574E1B4|nr:acyl-CoA dehydrogenase family protein [Variovorax sp. J22G47]MDM0059049.1 acyl-CoA dehydrogenase family protein [Variovorax sp. J22G47]